MATKVRKHAKDAPEVDGKVIQVIVGEEKAVFYVHQNLLLKSSTFFRNAINGPWKEGEEGIVRLPAHTPKSFKIYT
ncbi:hypothetical protein NA57DRAFT_80317 [Rhizodiscina lignyota]|uniref:BTB domain-containing protein n=1 Tax=Rhizodiscina lignyota TaxID=1504668 RepID=A0A9P4M2C9_9PEZI|nr:hypothetical protein NA57DRAFT_80317 [Rhizodiscina lignyota]